MPQGTYTPWSQEHLEILQDWMKKYPKKRSINMAMIKFSEPEKFQAIQDAGHTPRSMQDKVYAINFRNKKKAEATIKPSRSERATRLGDGRYKCNECGEIVEKKQSLAHHYARQHGGKQPGSKPMVVESLAATIPTVSTQLSTQPTQLNSWHYCPNCAFPLDH